MRLFLIARHWQIAILQLVPIACIFLVGKYLSPVQVSFMWFLLVSVSVIWLYSIGAAANLALEPALQKKVTIFRIAAFASLFIFVMVLPIMYQLSQTNSTHPAWLVYLLFAGLTSFYYMLWYASSQFVAAEKKAEPNYFEYALPMLGFWFSIVGVWFLQPRVNRLLGS